MWCSFIDRLFLTFTFAGFGEIKLPAKSVAPTIVTTASVFSLTADKSIVAKLSPELNDFKVAPCVPVTLPISLTGSENKTLAVFTSTYSTPLTSGRAVSL